MKKDLVSAVAFVLLAILGIGLVTLIGSQHQEITSQTIKPNTEPIAMVKPKNMDEVPKRIVNPVKKIPIKPAPAVLKDIKDQAISNEKKSEITEVDPPKSSNSEPKKEFTKTSTQGDGGKKITSLPKVEKIDVNKDPLPIVKKEDVPRAKILNGKIITLGDITKLNDPEGEYTVRPLDGEEKAILLGNIKSLILSGVKGKAQLDASDLNAERIRITDPIDGDSRVRIYTRQGSVLFESTVGGNSQLEVLAPQGKVTFKNDKTAIIQGNSRLSIAAREVELLGIIDGKVYIKVTLAREGSLTFSKMLGGAHLHYDKANPSDPEPRIGRGSIEGGSVFQKINSTKKR